MTRDTAAPPAHQELPAVPSIGQCAQLACVWEATAPKPGNVHRGADFEDVTYVDFVASALMIGPVLDTAPRRPLGQTVLRAIEATRAVVTTNTNLGLVLLLAPLAAAAEEPDLRAGLARVLSQLQPSDAADVFAAIRLAQPGGLGTADQHDIRGPAPDDLLAAMSAGAPHDLVARQYVIGFADVFDTVAGALQDALNHGWPLSHSIVLAFLHTLARHPDSLIARKCGTPVAERASAQAAHVLAQGAPGDQAFEQALLDFDFWLRSDGHRRNPGTTADLVGASLFVALRTGIIKLPLAWA